MAAVLPTRSAKVVDASIATEPQGKTAVATEPEEEREMVSIRTTGNAHYAFANARAKAKLARKDSTKKKLGMKDKCLMALNNRFCLHLTVMDIIEDDCRFRGTNVGAFLLIFVVFALAVLSIPQKEPPVMKDIRLASDAPASLSAGYVESGREGRKANAAAHTTKALVLNDDGSPRVGVSVEPRVVTFEASNPVVPCSTEDVKKMKDTLESLRFQEACQYKVEGSGQTDKLGMVRIENLKIDGPAGIYGFVMTAGNGVSISAETFTVLRPRVHRMRILNGSDLSRRLPPPQRVQVREPFLHQPAVQLFNEFGKPIRHVSVVAFSAPDPSWPPDDLKSVVPSYNMRGQKLAELGCSRSLPSDQEGIARFECLQVLGSTVDSLNIIFMVNAMVFYPWNHPAFEYGSILSLEHEFYMRPTVVSSKVARVEVTAPPPDRVVEGVAFPSMVSVRVLDKDGAGVRGAACYALIASEPGNNNIKLFRRHLMGFVPKQLLGAKSTESDSQGHASFPSLRFSSYGNVASQARQITTNDTKTAFGLQFFCDGLGSPVVTISSVKSRVAQVRIKRWIRDQAFISKYKSDEAEDGSDTFMVVVRVVDRHGKGVQGKTVFVRQDRPAGWNFYKDFPTVVGIEASGSNLEATTPAGFAVVAFRAFTGGWALRTPAMSQEFKVVLTVDGVDSEASIPLSLKVRQEVRTDKCNVIQISNIKFPELGKPLSEWQTVDTLSERPTLKSGATVLVEVTLATESITASMSFGSTPRAQQYKSYGRRLEEWAAKIAELMANGTLEWANVTQDWANGAQALANRAQAWANGAQAWANVTDGAQEWANAAQDWANGAQDWANATQDWANLAQDCANGGQDMANCAQDLAKGAQDLANGAQDVANSAQAQDLAEGAQNLALGFGNAKPEKPEVKARRLALEVEANDTQEALPPGVWRGRGTITARTAAGEITLSMQQAYSNKGKQFKIPFAGQVTDDTKVEHEPNHHDGSPLTHGRFVEMDWWPFELGIEMLDAWWGTIAFPMTFVGPPGTHWISLKAGISPRNHSRQICDSWPIAIELTCPLQQIHIEGELSHNVYNVSDTIFVNLVFNYSSHSRVIPIAGLTNGTEESIRTVRFIFEQVPAHWRHLQRRYRIFNKMDGKVMKLAVHSAFKGEVDDYGNHIGRMTISLQTQLAGAFGKYAVSFGYRGKKSPVFEFEIQEPHDLQAELIQEPGHSGESWPTLWPLPQQPILNITSNGEPINGLAIFAEFVPTDKYAYFERLSSVERVELFWHFSIPSGWTSTEAFLASSEPDGNEGEANYDSLLLKDGIGCGKIRFWLSSKARTELIPARELCFRPAAEYEIVSQPPASMPINMPLGRMTSSSQSEGTVAFTVHMTFPEGFTPAYTNWGVAAAKISVVKYQGKLLSREVALATTRELFDDFACVWEASKEIYGRCSDLEVVAAPVATLSFTVMALSWSRVYHRPSEVSLLVSDLSLSSMIKIEQVTMPAAFSQLNALEKAQFCYKAVGSSVKSSRTITPAEDIESGEMVTEPPEVVEVSATFLVRVKATTLSGGPVRGHMIKVGLVPKIVLDASVASGEVLQKIASYGNTLVAVQTDNVLLDPGSTVQRTNSQGMASFPLSILSAPSGDYVLKFQETGIPNSQVLFTTPAFTVVNPIVSITPAADDDWVMLRIERFDESVTIPRRLRFVVNITGGRSLEDLVQEGVSVSINLVMKSVNRKVEDKMAEMEKKAQQAYEENDPVESLQEIANQTLDDSTFTPWVSTFSQVDARFGGMSEELFTECLSTTMGALSLAADKTRKVAESRVPQFADAVKLDPDILDPQETMGQFFNGLTSGGSVMVSQAFMSRQFSCDLSISDVVLVAGKVDAAKNMFTGTYEVVRPFEFQFEENAHYVWAVTINGVKCDKTAFKSFVVKEIEMSPEKVVLNWVLTSFAGVLSLLLLATNSRRVHWLSYLVAIPASILGMVLESSKRQGGGKILTILSLTLVLASLCWGFSLAILTRFKARTGWTLKFGEPFGQRRIIVFEEYTRRRYLRMMMRKPGEPHASKLPLSLCVLQMIKPFNAETAFFFPSKLWAGFALSLTAFMYMLIQAIKLQMDFQESFFGLLHKAIEAACRMFYQMENQFRAVSGGAELPDEATQFVITQLELMRDWFHGLVKAIHIGLVIGVVLGAILTFVSMLATFFWFRRYALSMRNGVCNFKRSDGAVVYDSSFIGQFVAITMVGFFLIVCICVIICLPIAWDLPRRLIWSYREPIFWVLIVPTVLSKAGVLIAKKFIFGTYVVRHRPLASVFMFWQTWVSILSGVSSALTRFALAVLGVILGLPSLIMPATPESLNRIMLLDSPHKTFLSAVTMYHVHNHPIVIFVVRALQDFASERRQRRKDSVPEDELQLEARQRSQRWVMLLIMQHPWLAYHRKHAIKQRRQEEEAKKKKFSAMRIRPGAPHLGHSRSIPGYKQTVEEQELREAILEMKLMRDRANFHALQLESKLKEVREMPQGEKREQYARQAIENAVLVSPRCRNRFSTQGSSSRSFREPVQRLSTSTSEVLPEQEETSIESVSEEKLVMETSIVEVLPPAKTSAVEVPRLVLPQ